MRKLIPVMALLAASLMADTVAYVTAKGKTYHTFRDCQYLVHSAVLATDATRAETHGRHLCAVCAKRGKPGTPKTTGLTWAAPEVKK